ncbi:hypothetical protein Tco_0825290 [Tanacetum coccineum]
MTIKYCPSVEIKKLEAELWNLKVKVELFGDRPRSNGQGLPALRPHRPFLLELGSVDDLPFRNELLWSTPMGVFVSGTGRSQCASSNFSDRGMVFIRVILGIRFQDTFGITSTCPLVFGDTQLERHDE